MLSYVLRAHPSRCAYPGLTASRNDGSMGAAGKHYNIMYIYNLYVYMNESRDVLIIMVDGTNILDTTSNHATVYRAYLLYLCVADTRDRSGARASTNQG